MNVKSTHVQQIYLKLLILFIFINLLASSIQSQNMTSEPIKFQSLSPNLVVADVNRSIDFYINVLGFTFVASKPDTGTFEWGMVSKDDVIIMFQTYKSLREGISSIKAPSGSFGTLFIKVTGVENYYNLIKKRADVASELRLSEYGMLEFTIRDINGYYLTFAEEAK